MTKLETALSSALWDDAIVESRKLLAGPSAPFATGFRAQSLALEALGRSWEALFFALLWAEVGAQSDARAVAQRIATGPLTALDRLGESVAFVAGLPETWSTTPTALVREGAGGDARADPSFSGPSGDRVFRGSAAYQESCDPTGPAGRTAASRGCSG